MQFLNRVVLNPQPMEAPDTPENYLIVGSELFTDEDGNPLEDPLSPTELPVYKDAEANGVQIVSINSLHNYFRF